MTITNQTNPVGTSHLSKKIGVIVPQQGITENFERIYTSVRLTKKTNNPPTYTKEIVQYPNATSGSYTVIAKEKLDPETGKGTNEFEFNQGVDFKNTEKDTFKKLVQRKGLIKSQTKDAEKQIKDKVNEDKKNLNKNQADDTDSGDSTDSPNPGPPPNKGIARDNYGSMFYPSFIEKSNQDKLKITILEFSSRFKGGKRDRATAPEQPFKVDVQGKKTFIERGGVAGAINRKFGGGRVPLKLNQVDGSALSLDGRKRLEVNKRLVGHITLPIPDGVTDQNKVNFGGGTLNPLQVAGAEVALDFLLRGVGEAGKTAADVFKQSATDKNVQQAISNLITGSGLGVDTDQLLARTQGNIVNNNLELLFKGPTLRPFTFQFNFSPRDGGEARQVQKIIRALKQSSSVQRTPGGIFLATPNTYKLEFKNGRTNKTHEFLPRIKECALLGVNVNYMPENSYMTYSDSSMVAYNLQLAFQELEPIFNDDYEENDREQTGMTSMPGNPNTGGNIGF